ncbi:MAG: hypothetical protein L6R35_002102 [Caloplaca aegaea]|nr:MAG: hypothetical protein L6R35_002102 [Caloplaca aegaea]
MFCSRCDDILRQRLEPLNDVDEDKGALYIHHESLESLEAATAEPTKCRVCSTFLDSFTSGERQAVWEQKPLEYVTTAYLCRADHLKLATAFILVVNMDDNMLTPKMRDENRDFMLMMVFQPIEELVGTYCKRPSGSSTVSEESWDLAKGWLASCSREHEACGKGSKTSWYPTRLLDLGDAPDEVSSIRLVLMASEPVDAEYVTLSHRWGQASIFRLTKDTFAQLRDGFDISILPQTFQDAMAFAKRNLKIRYIWIDSLCIFQDADDRSDWMKEAAQMHRVYEHAYCNLSATGGEDSSVSLYRPRRTDSLCHVEVDLTFSILDPQASPTRYAMFDYHYWEKELFKCPLHYRGWVVQERLLARRVLHFCRNQLIWECNEMAASEAYPTGLPSIYQNQAKARLKSLDPDTEGRRLRQLATTESDSRFFAHQLWPRIVQLYSQCQLTKPEDKLIAISGIAKRMGSIIHDEYVVGMWRRYLPSELLWFVDHHRQSNGQPSVRPEKYRAPSFSWASVEGCISAGTPVEEGILFSVKELSIDHVTEDITGLVKGGFIVLEGALKRLGLRRPSVPIDMWLVNVNGRDLLRHTDEEWGPTSLLVHLDVEQADFEVENVAQTLYCMPARQPDGRYWSFLVCLILEHLGEGIFRRLGKIWTDEAEEIDFILRRGENESLMPCQTFDAESGGHTFRVI